MFSNNIRVNKMDVSAIKKNAACGIEDALCTAAEKIAAALRACYSDDADSKTLENAELYSLMAGGKRIRPFLVLEFCRLFGGSEAAAMPFACAIEMLHTFSLIHDDLPCMDNDDMRRGRPTNHRVNGEAVALLAGDALEVRAVSAALANKCVTLLDAVRAATIICRGSVAMIEGQIMDIAAEERRISEEELITLQSKKTGELIRVSTALGCIAAGVPDVDERMSSAIRYADGIGRAFQVIDDILDAESTAEELGKTAGSDARDGKTTYLSFMSADEARALAAKLTEDAVSAISKYSGAETLVSLAEWLLCRKK